MAAFHGLYAGVNLTDDADNLFQQGQPWNGRQRRAARSELGPLHREVGADAGQYDSWVTWGAEQKSTHCWTAACLDEAWVIISQEDANATGLDLAALRADINALHGTAG